MVERKEFKTLQIDVKKGIFLLNGKDMEGISRINLDFTNGEWWLLITKDEIYEQATPSNENHLIKEI